MADDEDFTADADMDGNMADLAEELGEIAEVDGETVAKESRALKFLLTHHPECRLDYVEQVQEKLSVAAYPPDSGSDAQHKSVPYLTMFEKAKILGFRANQLAQGSQTFLEKRPEHVVDVLEIARLELEERRLPYILKRPMPDGSFEYVRLSDLLIL